MHIFNIIYNGSGQDLWYDNNLMPAIWPQARILYEVEDIFIFKKQKLQTIKIFPHL